MSFVLKITYSSDNLHVYISHLVSFGIRVLQETGIYEMSMFEVSDQQQVMNPVDNPMIIMIGEITVVRAMESHLQLENFPERTFRLTPIHRLPNPTDPPTQYIDVMGVIRGISDVATLTMPGRNGLLSRSNNEVKITLWGESAVRFNGEVIRFLGADEWAGVIFVGLTIFMVEGVKELSGSSASRWYINEDIEKINVLRASLQPLVEPIARLPSPCQMTLRVASDFHQPVQNLSVLLNNNPLHGLPPRFRCVVRMWRVTPGKKWWFARCVNCLRPGVPIDSTPAQADNYSCLTTGCPCTGITIEYRLHLLGFDNTGEAGFIFFGKVAEDLIGISAHQLVLTNLEAGVNPTNLAAAAASITHTPPALAAVLDWSYRLVLFAMPTSFEEIWANFYISTIEDAYAPE